MRLIIGILLLLLPVLLWGADKKFEVKTATEITQEANTIDRVNKRTKYIQVLERDSINSKVFVARVNLTGDPLHWDSSGTWARYRFTKKQAAVGKAAELDNQITVDYDEEYSVGPFKAEFLSTRPGKVRYSKRGTSLEFISAYDTTNTKTIATVSKAGIKEVVELTFKSPIRLAYGYKLAGHDTTRALKEGQPIYGADGTINGFFPSLTATDQNGQSRSVAVTITADSLIAVLSSISEGDTVWLDPTVNDTVYVTNSAYLLNGVGADFDAWRTSETASTVDNLLFQAGAIANSIIRCALSFPLDNLDVPSSITSVTMFLFQNGGWPVSPDTTFGFFISGSFTGSPAAGWFNDFSNWRANAAPWDQDSLGILADSLLWVSSGSGFDSTPFTQAGKDSVLSVMGSDTLRVMVISKHDIDAEERFDSDEDFVFSTSATELPYLVIDYITGAAGPASVAGITTTPASVAGLTSRSKTAGIE